MHYDHVVAGLDRGVHVLYEKPLVTELEQARDLDARDASSDVVLAVAYQRHLAPAYRYGRDRWADGDRHPRFATAEITQDLFGSVAEGREWYLDPEASGGGHLYSTGTHLLDALLWMTGLRPTAVTASLDLHDGTERSPYLRGPERTQAAAFVESIRTGTPPPATARDALRVTAVTEAAYEANRYGRSVTVDLPDDRDERDS